MSPMFPPPPIGTLYHHSRSKLTKLLSMYIATVLRR
jgi:hypothetical protein